MRLPAIVLVLSIASGSAAAQDLAADARRRNDALVAEGFNLTQGWSLDARSQRTTIRLDLFVPEAGEHTFSFWASTKQGAFGFRLLGPDGQALASWTGRSGDVTVALDAPMGKYAVEIERDAGTSGRALFGAKGPTLPRCEVAGVQERAALPAKGFHWPYLLFVPKTVRSRHLLVVPNNTGFPTEDVELLRMAGSCQIKGQIALAERLGAPLLVPLFPRPATKGEEENLYLHALTRASLETKVERLRRVDLQLVAVIDDARAALALDLDRRVLMWGFSASASFVNRFAILHPDRVAAVASGSPGGWPIAPVAEVGGERLTYPVGVADLKELTGKPLDTAQLKRVSFFFFLGDKDENDAVPFRDSFSKTDEGIIFRRFGKTPVSRWKTAERLYAGAGVDARFTLYPGAAHSVTPEMAADIAAFMEKAAAAP